MVFSGAAGVLAIDSVKADSLDFSKGKFESLSLSDVESTAQVRFDSVTSDNVSLSESTLGGVDFTGARIGQLTIHDSAFTSEAKFHGTFAKQLQARAVEFGGRASFSEATLGRTSFERCRFRQGAEFHRAADFSAEISVKIQTSRKDHLARASTWIIPPRG